MRNKKKLDIYFDSIDLSYENVNIDNFLKLCECWRNVEDSSEGKVKKYISSVINKDIMSILNYDIKYNNLYNGDTIDSKDILITFF